ncbi:MAG: NUDIX domain-containing protein [Rhizobiaceae bacterium]
MKTSILRRGVHGLFLMKRGLTLGVRGVLHDRQGRVLLVRHTYVKGWHFPGGGVEPHENAVQALEREVREEASIQLGSPPVLYNVYHNHALNGRDHVLVYRCETWEEAGPFKPGAEISDARFFALDALPDDVSSGTSRRIGELFNGSPVSSDW